jgi:hypothetical protein
MRAPKLLDTFDLDGFAAFWLAYPRHEAKKDAFKAWCQVKPSSEVQEQIRAALVWQTQQPNWKQSMRYIPLPASYLRGERWTDEAVWIPCRSHVDPMWKCLTCRSQNPAKLLVCVCGTKRPSV